MKVRILFLILFITNCNPKNSKLEDDNSPNIFLTNYWKVDDKNLKLKFGDLVEFNIGKENIKAIVLDISPENDGNWFGLCFLNGNQIFGRKIPQGFGGHCVDLCDFSYLHENAISNYKVLKNIKVNFKKIGRGMDSPTKNLQDILRDYRNGLEVRKKKQTPCEDKLGELNPVNECYFPLSKFQ
ncbi:hypothetical protein [Epilithonimonas lactis]|uniref:Uncharacterized protein n=1 Tax=Epilithonimonas lactis TaxID=421072 RepID=A0A085B6U9_9FLAO|nr:hypothetical protein [Epilithonimonas lactis]KFC18194.1 hypothetical protein IO89_18880 [Epilithonimonas lactis]SER09030.1 hypothetical protein SAMN04488097_3858 [Epilithonimonas lactis]